MLQSKIEYVNQVIMELTIQKALIKTEVAKTDMRVPTPKAIKLIRMMGINGFEEFTATTDLMLLEMNIIPYSLK